MQALAPGVPRSGYIAQLTVALCMSGALGLDAQASQPIGLNAWGPQAGGTVNAIAQSGNTIYVGGDFTRIQSVIGGGVPVNPATGARIPGFPAVAGYVYAAIPDGAHGWFIGGEFSGVGGIPRRNLAHVLAHGDVADWSPNPDGIVQSLVIRGRALIVGGAYTTLAGKRRDNVGAVDIYTGASLPWRVGTDQGIFTMLLHGDRLYLGGYFTQVAGQPRLGLAAIDLSRGTLLPWDPGAGGYVYAMVAFDDTVVVGGRFTTLGGESRAYLGAVGMESGLATTWNPNVSQAPRALVSPDVVGLAANHDTLYVAGVFDSIGGTVRRGLAAVSLRDRVVTTWDPNPVPVDGYPPIFTFVGLHDGRLYVAGLFDSVGGVEAPNEASTASLDLRTAAGNPAWRVTPNDGIMVIASDDQNVFLGGFFTSIGEQLPRDGLAAFDARTGLPTQWQPKLDGFVRALAVRDGRIYVGGDFLHVNQVLRPFLAEVDSASGTVAAWEPRCSGAVWSLAVTDSLVYAGGLFGLMGDSLRTNLAAVGRGTGLATEWAPQPDDIVNAIVPDGERVLIAGDFSHVGNQSRLYAGAVDAHTGLVTPWDPRPNSFVNALALKDSVVFMGGLFDQVGGAPRFGVAAVHAASGSVLSWRGDVFASNPGPDVKKLVATDDALYVAGRFTSINGADREGIAAVDLAIGSVLDWEANLNGTAWAMSAGRDDLLVGGSFQRVGVSSVSLIASIAPYVRRQSGPPPIIENPIADLSITSPARQSAFLRFGLIRDAQVQVRIYDLQGRVVQATPPTSAIGGPQVIELPTAGLPIGCYVVRVSAGDGAAAKKFLVVR